MFFFLTCTIVIFSSIITPFPEMICFKPRTGVLMRMKNGPWLRMDLFIFPRLSTRIIVLPTILTTNQKMAFPLSVFDQVHHSIPISSWSKVALGCTDADKIRYKVDIHKDETLTEATITVSPRDDQESAGTLELYVQQAAAEVERVRLRQYRQCGREWETRFSMHSYLRPATCKRNMQPNQE